MLNRDKMVHQIALPPRLIQLFPGEFLEIMTFSSYEKWRPKTLGHIQALGVFFWGSLLWIHVCMPLESGLTHVCFDLQSMVKVMKLQYQSQLLRGLSVSAS